MPGIRQNLLLYNAGVKCSLTLLFVKPCGLRGVHQVELLDLRVSGVAVIVIRRLKLCDRNRIRLSGGTVLRDLSKAFTGRTVTGFDAGEICEVCARS